MKNKKLQELIGEAKEALKDYPYFNALSAAEGSDIWDSLSEKQRESIARSMPCLEYAKEN